MLIGEYNYALDAKGRLNFPAKLREDLGDHFFIAKGLGEHCLYVYSLAEWQKFIDKIDALPFSKARKLQRELFASACEVEPDKQGRIVVPANLREHGELEKDVVIIGTSNRCEIWSKANWDAYLAESTPEAIEEAMDELGF